MPELEVIFKTRSELAGAQQALDAIEKQIGKAKALGGEYAILEARAAGIRSTIAAATAAQAQAGAATGAVAAAHTKAATATAEHAKQSKTLQSVMFALNDLIPGLGTAMQYAISPIGAALGLAVIAWRMFSDQIRESNAEFRRLSDEAARPLTNRLEAQRQTIIGTTVALDGFHDRLQAAARGEQTLSEQTAQNISRVKDQQQAAGDLADALYERQKAGLDWMHKHGYATERQYLDQKLSLQIGYEQKKREIQEQGALEEIMIRRRMLEDAKDEQGAKNKAAEESTKAEGKALEDLAAQATPEEARQQARDASKKIEAWAEKENISPGMLAQFEAMGPGLSLEQQGAIINARAAAGKHVYIGAEKQYDQWSQLERSRLSYNKLADQAPKAYAEKRAAANRASARTDLLQRQAIEGEEYIAQQERTLSHDRSRWDQQHATGQQIGQLKAETAFLETYGPQLPPGQVNITAAATRLQGTTGRQEAALLQALGVVEQTQMRQIQLINRWGRQFSASLSQIGGWARASR